LAFYEDIEDVDERPRVEVEDGWCLVLMRIPYKVNNNSGTFSTVPLGIIFKDDIFVSVCCYQTDIIPDFIQYTKRKKINKTDNINFVFRLLLSSSIWFLKYLKSINAMIKAAEKELETSVENDDLKTLSNLDRTLVYFTSALRGNEILTHKLKNMRGIKEIYDPDLVEDVEIESKQALETTNIYATILNSTLETYATVISNNLNMVMKRLTSINVILMLPTLIASFFGMNLEIGTSIFNWMFYIAVFISIAFTALSAVFFYKKKWF
jgi:magnesium transporter